MHQHYLYRGYLQIAALDLTRSNTPALWLLHWDPTQPIATRPLSLRKNGTWYTYGHDLTKNVTELYKADGTIATAYDYTPYGSVTASGIDQPIQWSSEHYDPELALVYYNYRHYNPADGRWINRDPIAEEGGRNLYGFVGNILRNVDLKGLKGYPACVLTKGIVTQQGKFIRRTWVGPEHITTRRKCYYRCYHRGTDNCYSIPCVPWCKKDHGVEILITTVSNKTNIPAPSCSSIIHLIEDGTLQSGDVVRR